MRRLEVGGFSIRFGKTAHFVLVRLSKDQGLEIRIDQKPPAKLRDAHEFVVATPTSIAFSTKGSFGVFSEDYIQENPISDRFQELFEKLIKQERGSRRLYESRFMILKEEGVR